MKLDELLNQSLQSMGGLERYRNFLGRHGYCEDNLPTDVHLKAWAIMGDHGRQDIDFHQSDLVAFHSKGLLGECGAVDEIPTPVLRFFHNARRWVDVSTNYRGLLAAATEKDTDIEEFPLGALVSPELVSLKMPGLPVEIMLLVRHDKIDHLAYVMPCADITTIEHVEGYIGDNSGGDGLVIIPVRVPLIASGVPSVESEDSPCLTIVGSRGDAVYRRRIPVVMMTPEQRLNSVLPPVVQDMTMLNVAHIVADLAPWVLGSDKAHRLGVWLQGCSLGRQGACKGCMSRHTHAEGGIVCLTPGNC